MIKTGLIVLGFTPYRQYSSHVTADYNWESSSTDQWSLFCEQSVPVPNCRLSTVAPGLTFVQSFCRCTPSVVWIVLPTALSCKIIFQLLFKHEH